MVFFHKYNAKKNVYKYYTFTHILHGGAFSIINEERKIIILNNGNTFFAYIFFSLIYCK